MKSWFIPGNVPSSKNSRQWTGKYFIASKSTQNWRKATSIHWEEFKEEFLQEIAQRPLPLKIHFKFIRGTKHKFDYVNPLQTIQDEMVHHGWLEDDNADILIPVLEEFEYSKENPGVYITL